MIFVQLRNTVNMIKMTKNTVFEIRVDWITDNPDKTNRLTVLLRIFSSPDLLRVILDGVFHKVVRGEFMHMIF